MVFVHYDPPVALINHEALVEAQWSATGLGSILPIILLPQPQRMDIKRQHAKRFAVREEHLQKLQTDVLASSYELFCRFCPLQMDGTPQERGMLCKEDSFAPETTWIKSALGAPTHGVSLLVNLSRVESCATETDPCSWHSPWLPPARHSWCRRRSSCRSSRDPVSPRRCANPPVAITGSEPGLNILHGGLSPCNILQLR